MAEAEQRDGGRGPCVLVGQAEGREGEAAGPVDVVADQVLPRVHAGEAVGQAHLGLDRPLVAQVVGEAAPRLELRAGDRQRAPALPARLERDAERGPVQVEVDAVPDAPDRVPDVVGLGLLLDHPEHLAEAVDQVVVDLVALEVVQQVLAGVAQLAVEGLLERPDVALGGVEDDADRAVLDAGLQAAARGRRRGSGAARRPRRTRCRCAARCCTTRSRRRPAPSRSARARRRAARRAATRRRAASPPGASAAAGRRQRQRAGGGVRPAAARVGGEREAGRRDHDHQRGVQQVARAARQHPARRAPVRRARRSGCPSAASASCRRGSAGTPASATARRDRLQLLVDVLVALQRAAQVAQLLDRVPDLAAALLELRDRVRAQADERRRLRRRRPWGRPRSRRASRRLAGARSSPRVRRHRCPTVRAPKASPTANY